MNAKSNDDPKQKPTMSMKKLGAIFCVIILCIVSFYFVFGGFDDPPSDSITPTLDLTMKFPRDEGAHDQMVEIWTFSGFFDTKSGLSFSYQVSYYNTGIRSITFIDEDNMTGTKYYTSRSYADDTRTPSLNIITGNESLNISYTNGLIKDTWQTMEPNKYELNSVIYSGSQELAQINISLHSKKDHVPVGDENGKTFLGETGTIHSYFQSGIIMSGVIYIDDTKYEVSGMGWIEHSWGDWSSLITESWNIVLSNRVELYVSKIYDLSGVIKLERYYLVDAYGSVKADSRTSDEDLDADPSIQNLRYWLDTTDPSRQRAYSHSWRLVSEKNSYNLTIEPIISDQKAMTSWDGVCSVNGMVYGNNVGGKCYAILIKRYSSTLTVTDLKDNFNTLGIPNDPVTVNVNVFDDLPISGVTLFYRLDGGEEHSLDMINGDLGWSGVIPGQRLGIDVEYWIVARDLADKTFTSYPQTYKVEI